ncbi:MAG: S-methyl-5'-thioinosine phosphorylase [Gammaproteobacteria bacterium]|nr:S-methyl-5'-thioinosine phosphorylase [Gammaproteobacteria bacterium]
MTTVALIGGSGFGRLAEFEINDEKHVKTPYGPPSAPILSGRLQGEPLLFLARHGQAHSIPPHRINYRANIWALKHAGAELVIGIAAVGGITRHCLPGALVVPDQIIDYTWGREHTFHNGGDSAVTHIEFTQPYCEELRELIIQACGKVNIPVIEAGCYAATQGPRFETVAEINKLEIDGADIIGMTGMPEASLARELGLCYATIAIVVNAAAGRGSGIIAASDIQQTFVNATKTIHRILTAVIPIAHDMKYEIPEAIQP